MILNLQEKIDKLVQVANFNLRKDVLKFLKVAYKNEKNRMAKTALGWIIENAKVAKKQNLAICQDTGLPIVFIEIGKKIKISNYLIDKIVKEIEASYKKNYLRASLFEPIAKESPNYRGVIYHIEYSKKFSGLKITLLVKGFGSENKTKLKMFNPTVSLKEIEDFVVKSIQEAGPEACPPFFVGVGIGGTAEYAIFLAKKALLENLTKKNKDPVLAKLEKKLLHKINKLNIGPMGFGSKHSCLAVKIKKAKTHIAGLAVAVNINCHALRSASLKIL